jgi:hypothetical protein
VKQPVKQVVQDKQIRNTDIEEKGMGAPRPATKQQPRIKTRRLYSGFTRTKRLLKRAAHDDDAA